MSRTAGLAGAVVAALALIGAALAADSPVLGGAGLLVLGVAAVAFSGDLAADPTTPGMVGPRPVRRTLAILFGAACAVAGVLALAGVVPW